MSLIIYLVKKFHSISSSTTLCWSISASVRSISCGRREKWRGGGLKYSSTKSLRITCFCHYASHPVLCWKLSTLHFCFWLFFFSFDRPPVSQPSLSDESYPVTFWALHKSLVFPCGAQSSSSQFFQSKWSLSVFVTILSIRSNNYNFKFPLDTKNHNLSPEIIIILQHPEHKHNISLVLWWWMVTSTNNTPKRFSLCPSRHLSVQVIHSLRTFPSWPQWSLGRATTPSCCLCTMNRASSSSDWKWVALPCSCTRTTQANPALRTTPCSEESI